MWCVFVCLFVFKQKTAYEMRISDWSSACALPISGRRRSCDRFSSVQSFFGSEAEAERRARVAAGLGIGVGDGRGGREPAHVAPPGIFFEIGRASCRERVCQYV